VVTLAGQSARCSVPSPRMKTENVPGIGRLSRPCDGFRLAYELIGDGPDLVLLHGWPGTRHDYREATPLLVGGARIVVLDLRGFGGSDKHHLPPKEFYSHDAQVRSVLALLDELEIQRAVFGGYDVGSRVLQALARAAPDRVAGLMMTPPQPGAGQRLLAPSVQREFWYQTFHRIDLAEALIDGDAKAVRHYWLILGNTGPVPSSISPTTIWITSLQPTHDQVPSWRRSPGTDPGRFPRPVLPNSRRPPDTTSTRQQKFSGRRTIHCLLPNGPTGSRSGSPTFG